MPILKGVRLGGSMGSCSRFPGHRPRTDPDDSTTRSDPAAGRTRPRLHRADLPPVRHAPARRRPDHRPSHRRQPPADPRRCGIAPGHRTDYQRVLSRAPWSALDLGCALAGFILRHLAPDGPVLLVGDDTVDGHPGKKVYGKARHRDPVRSTHSHTAWRYGHKWVVLAVLVHFPFASRPWALPILVDLYRSVEDDRRRNRPHRTPAQLMCRLLRLMLIRFPDRSFAFVGDAGYGTHEVARFCHRHRDRLALVSKLHPEANLFEPPPPYRGNGRPPVKGPRRPKPGEAVAAARRLKRQTVAY